MAKNDTFTTPKGTELPLIKLKGKNYMQVAHRLVWFEEENQHYDITQQELTPLIDQNGKQVEFAIIKTTITILTPNANGQLMVKRKVCATKCEHKAHFGDYHEKAETGSLGRALAMLGYGTQFAEPDLDEGDRIVDSPIDNAKKADPKKTGSFRRAASKPVEVVENNNEGDDEDDF